MARKKSGQKRAPLYVDLAKEELGYGVKERERDSSAEQNSDELLGEQIGDKDAKRIIDLADKQLQEEEDKHILPKTEFDDSDSLNDLGNEQYYEGEDLEIDPLDEEIFQKFAPQDAVQRVSLSEMIQQKIDEITGNASAVCFKKNAKSAKRLDPSLIEVYTKVAVILSRYKSGKLPKVVKMIPRLANWQEIVCITKPHTWTPNATYEMARMFISNFTPYMVNGFLRDILLERVRDDIKSNKKLNYHLYRALKKAVYKPAGFFKGIILPLCTSNCTLREAAIIGSVVAKVSIPVLHSAAALLKLSELEYTGATSLFIRILLNKKYALPYKTIDTLCEHFARMQSVKMQLPVLWHQSLLVFVQRYKDDLSSERREMILSLIKTHCHKLITPEIRREIVHSKPKESNEMDWRELPEKRAITFCI